MPDRDNQPQLDDHPWRHRRGDLLRFLDDLRIEPANNRAERVLRPAVIARKVSQCSGIKRLTELHRLPPASAAKQ